MKKYLFLFAVCVSLALPNILYPDSNLYSAYSSSIFPQINVNIIHQNPEKVEFKITYKGDFNNVSQITQKICINKERISIQDHLKGEIKTMRIYYPMLTNNGISRTKIQLKGQKILLEMQKQKIVFEAITPKKSTIKRMNKNLYYRNGYADIAYFDSKDNSHTMEYQIKNL